MGHFKCPNGLLSLSRIIHSKIIECGANLSSGFANHWRRWLPTSLSPDIILSDVLCEQVLPHQLMVSSKTFHMSTDFYTVLYSSVSDDQLMVSSKTYHMSKDFHPVFYSSVSEDRLGWAKTKAKGERVFYNVFHNGPLVSSDHLVSPGWKRNPGGESSTDPVSKHLDVLLHASSHTSAWVADGGVLSCDS